MYCRRTTCVMNIRTILKKAEIVDIQRFQLFSLILETTGYAGGGAPQKALASSIERSELVTKNNKLAQVRKDV